MITLVLSLVASGKKQSIASQASQFFKTARRNGLWENAESVHPSAVTRAREKLQWITFEKLFRESVKMAYEVFPSKEKYLWKGMSVFAFDGSHYRLPGTKNIRAHFDPNAGIGSKNHGRGHYPLCLVSTVYDVFRRIPIARTVVPRLEGNERKEALKMLDDIPEGGVLLFDRGYPSYELFLELNKHYDGFYVVRCPIGTTFNPVKQFVASGKNDDIIEMHPSFNYINKYSAAIAKSNPRIKLRIIRLISPTGEISVLLTNLFSEERYTKESVIDLYFKRWEVETHYRNEKTIHELEQFHSRSVNGVMQEFFAIAIMTVISQTLVALASKSDAHGKSFIEPQLKNTMVTLAADAAVMSAENPTLAMTIFYELIEDIKRIKYYRPKKSKPSQPRVSKHPVNKWRLRKSSKIY